MSIKRMHLTDPVCHGPGISRPAYTETKAGNVDNRLARAAPARPAGDARRYLDKGEAAFSRLIDDPDMED